MSRWGEEEKEEEENLKFWVKGGEKVDEDEGGGEAEREWGERGRPPC